MGDARAALRAIVSDPAHGVAALDDPRVVSNLLSDYLPDAPRESGLLMAAVTAGVPGILRDHVGQGMDPDTAVQLTAASLAARTAFTTGSCRWVTAEIARAQGYEVSGNVPGATGPGATVRATTGTRTQTIQRVPATRQPAATGPVAPKGKETAGELLVTTAGIVVVIAVVIAVSIVSAGALARAFISYHNPSLQVTHVVSVPASLNGYVRQPAQASQTAQQLKSRILTRAGTSVSNVVAATYEKPSGSATGPQVMVFIGGNSSSSGDFISGITELRGSFTTNAGPLGGQAACAPSTNGNPVECAWADGDTFGILVSATLNATALASEMRLMRPLVEYVRGQNMVRVPGPAVTQTVTVTPSPKIIIRYRQAQPTAPVPPAQFCGPIPASALAFSGVTACAAPGLPLPVDTSGTWAVTVNCLIAQCTSFSEAGPDGSTCGAVVGEEQVCVG
jgi:hypothetical protein